MDRERWLLIDRIFHEAAARPDAERGHYLDEACGADPSIRAMIERLLAHDEGSPSFVDQPVLANVDRAIPDPRVGRCVGPYRILERIAEGGMGVVYRAEREDGVAGYPVAIKLVRTGMDNERILRRFLTERETLASLNHPNIARLLDGGAAEDGLPYLVMEFVEGDPIDVYCDRHRLSVPERLRLVCTVCHAAHHAHQNLVVHRDLKPGNILVNREGVPKLLDFGIAKLLQPGDVESAVDRTETAFRVLTPEYASPEQIRGDVVTTATDVYSLGIVLYGLLTGNRPFHPGSARMEDVASTISHRDPTRPSSAVGVGPTTVHWWGGQGRPDISPEHVACARRSTPERLRRMLRGDLDNIVMTALRKEPSRRYASAEQLAEDIGRYLDGLPIAARRDTMIYRSAKFVRRNRLGVLSAAVIVVALAASAVVSARMAHVAATERDAAREAREHAERGEAHARIESDSANEVARILRAAFFESAAPDDGAGEGGRVGRVPETLDREVRRINRQFADQGHLRANLLDAVGATMLDLGLPEQAEPLIALALEVRLAEFGPESLEVARSFDSRGRLLTSRGDLVDAEAEFRRALELHRRLPEGVHTDVATTASRLATTLYELGRLSEAEALHEEALSIRRRVLDAHDPVVAESLESLARIDLVRGDRRGAERRLREALEIRRRTLDDNHPLVVGTSLLLADVAPRTGDPAADVPPPPARSGDAADRR